MSKHFAMVQNVQDKEFGTPVPVRAKIDMLGGIRDFAKIGYSDW